MKYQPDSIGVFLGLCIRILTNKKFNSKVDMHRFPWADAFRDFRRYLEREGKFRTQKRRSRNDVHN